jgi:hypothetical protein
MSLAPVLLHGTFSTPVCTAGKITRRKDELDAGLHSFVSSNEYEYSAGQSVPGYAGLIIDFIDTVNDGGGVYEHTLTSYGVAGGKAARQIRGFPEPAYNLNDWDSIDDKWITNSPHFFTIGQSGSYGGSTVCISANPKPLGVAGWFLMHGRFVGMVSPKNAVRKITCDSQEISGDLITVPIPGGWNAPLKGSVALPEIVVEDTFFTTTPPPTQLVPSPNTPPNPPTINATINGIAFSSEGGATIHYPHGWSLISVSGDPVGSAGPWKNVLRWKFRWPFTP